MIRPWRRLRGNRPLCIVDVVGLPANGGRNKGIGMAEKLGIGATFPKMTLSLVDGGTLDLPDGLDAKYRIILFYRGHW
jgi:hypothetical protein